MKFAADDLHKEYFLQNKAIEFEGVFTDEEIRALKEGVQNVLSQRLKVSASKVKGQNANVLFEAGRDLWRKHEGLQKIVLNRRLGEVVFQLTGERPIRIGYDQFFPKMDKTSKLVPGKYDKFFERPFPFKDACSMQGIACGLLIALDDREPKTLGNQFSPQLPFKMGNALFLHPQATVDWPELFGGGQGEYYLIVYAMGTCLYSISPQDPLSRFLMREGYVAGDRLSDTTNPIVFR